MMSRRDKKDKNNKNESIEEKEQRRRNFVIARIEEEEIDNRKLDVIVSPYRGTRNTDDNKQNKEVFDANNKKSDTYGLKTNREDLNRLAGADKKVPVANNQDNKVLDKYSPERIPSYLRSEGGGISKKNLAALRGDKTNPEEEIEKNRRIFGRNYQMFLGEEKEVKPNTPNNTNTPNNKLTEDIYFEENIDINEKPSNNLNNIDNNYYQDDAISIPFVVYM